MLRWCRFLVGLTVLFIMPVGGVASDGDELVDVGRLPTTEISASSNKSRKLDKFWATRTDRCHWLRFEFGQAVAVHRIHAAYDTRPIFLRSRPKKFFVTIISAAFVWPVVKRLAVPACSTPCLSGRGLILARRYKSLKASDCSLRLPRLCRSPSAGQPIASAGMSISQTDAWIIVGPIDPRTTQVTNVGLAMTDGTPKQSSPANHNSAEA